LFIQRTASGRWQRTSRFGGGHTLSFENRYLCKDGSYRWPLWNATANVATQTIYSVARDITERKNAEEEQGWLVQELQTALAEVSQLRNILPICMYCKHVRDDANYWLTVEEYISKHTQTRFSHGVCPECDQTVVKKWLDEKKAG